MPQLAQRLGLDLPDALAGDFEVLADLFQRVVGLLADAEAHAQDLLFARRQRRQHFAGLLGQVHVDDRIGRRGDGLVLDEVAQVAVLFLADGRLEADGLLGDLEDLADLVERQLHLLGDLFRSGLAADLLHQVARGADELVDGLDHVHRNADGARLIGDGSGDGLADPPRRIGSELVAALVFELVDRLHQADVAFLNQVEELQAAVGVLLRDRYDQAEVRLDQLGLGLLGLALAGDDGVEAALELVHREQRLFLDALHLPRSSGDGAAHFAQIVAFEAHRLELLARHEARLAFVLGFAEQALQFAQRNARAHLDLVQLTLDLIDPLDELLEVFNNALDLALVQLNVRERLGHRRFVAEDGVAHFLALAVGDLLGLRVELLAEHLVVVVEPADLLDQLHHLIGAPLLVEGLVVLVWRVADDLTHAHLALLETLADLDDLLDGDGRVQNRLENFLLAVLDALRDLHLALAGEERNRAHLAQVHAHRVVRLRVGVFLFLALGTLGGRGLFGFLGRRRLRIGLLRLRQLDLVGLVDDGDVVVAEHRHHVVDLVGADDVRRERVVDLVIGEEALVAAHGEQVLHFLAVGRLAALLDREVVVVFVVGVNDVVVVLARFGNGGVGVGLFGLTLFALFLFALGGLLGLL